MLKYRRCICLFLTPVAFAVLWYFENAANLRTIGLLGNKMYYFMNSTNYAGQLTCYMILPLFYLLLLKNFFLPEKICLIVREKSRAVFYGKRLLRAGIVSAFFSFTYILVQVIGICLCFETSLLLKTHFFLYASLHCVYVFLFFIEIGLVFYLIMDLISGANRSLVATGALFAIYGAVRFSVSMPFWTPYDDMVLLSDGIQNILSSMDIAIIFAIAAAIPAALCLIGACVFQRRSFYQSEKR